MLRRFHAWLPAAIGLLATAGTDTVASCRECGGPIPCPPAMDWNDSTCKCEWVDQPDVHVDASTCPAPVAHGDACAEEGRTACGRKRICAGVGTIEVTECVCEKGRYSCGACPACMAQLRTDGCLVGQTCDGVTFQACDGSSNTTSSTCTCAFGERWVCEQEDGGEQIFEFCARDGGAGD